MSGIEGLIAILSVALMPVALVFISRYFAFREKELILRSEGDPDRLQELLDAKRQLEARVETLESIVCTTDFELNRRLHGLCAPADGRPGAPSRSAALPETCSFPREAEAARK